MTKKKKKRCSNVYIAIDPGKSGGIAVIGEDFIKAYKCPDNPIDMAVIFGVAINSGDKPIVAIEKVWAFPGDAKSRAFNFGQNYGMWKGIAGSFEIQMKEIPPKEWMGYFNIPKNMLKNKRKKWIKEKAQKIHPKTKVTLNVSDAILIAEYLKSTVTSH